MNGTSDRDTLVLRALRLAEFAHRKRPQGPQLRKAPTGEDRPPYFIHLAEVGWMLQEAGLDPEVVAAGFLHDIIEDCDYTRERLASEIGNDVVAEYVDWVSEEKSDSVTGNKRSWEDRNRGYLQRLQDAPPAALAISCADKTANMLDMCRFAKGGHPVHTYTKKDHDTQLAKFRALLKLFVDRVPRKLYDRYCLTLAEFEKGV